MGIETALGVSAGGSLLGGLLGAGASRSAARTQADAAKYAANLQFLAAQQGLDFTKSVYEQNVNRLAPFVNLGVGGARAIENRMGNLANPVPNQINALNLHSPLPNLPHFNPTMESLSKTPGYQFTLGQGLKSLQNSYAAQGLGISGAAMKGAAKYASGLAATTYQNQFSNWLNQQNLALNNYSTESGILFNQASTGQNFNLAQRLQRYNMLYNMASLGENAAAGVGSQGIQAAGQVNNALMSGATGIGNFLTSGAAATAGGIVGSTNALTGALGNASNLPFLYSLLNNSNPSGGGENSLFPSSGNAWGVPSWMAGYGYSQ